MTKRIISVIAVFVIVLSLLFVGCGVENIEESSEVTEEIEFSVTDETAAIDYSAYAGTTINVYNWGEYISDGIDGTVDVNEEFTKLTGIKVNYTNFASNEDMYAKIKAGGVSYDIIIPSDYMIARLISENMLQKLNFTNIPNYKYILDDYKDLYFDENNEYSVPYNVGIVGIIYNTKMVDYTPDSWSVFWDENLEGKILMINNPRDAFAIAQFYQGIDINTEDPAELTKAKDKLSEQKPLVKAYVMDEIFNKMESGAAAVAPYYAGDFLTMYGNNKDLAFAMPKEGTNIFVDSICIPKCAKHKEAAELYINFLLDTNVALQNAERLCYTTPHKEVASSEEYLEFVKELHPNAESILNPDFASVYPGIDVRDYYFRNLSIDANSKMTELWTDLKIEGSNNIVLYVTCGVLVVGLICLFVYLKVRKARREREE